MEVREPDKLLGRAPLIGRAPAHMGAEGHRGSSIATVELKRCHPGQKR